MIDIPMYDEVKYVIVGFYESIPELLSESLAAGTEVRRQNA